MEREFIAEVLNGYVIYIKHCMQEEYEGEPKQMTADEMTIDSVLDVTEILIFDLYFLARCGDESAFLELLNLESAFISHPFFLRSFMSWQAEAMAGNKTSEEILRNLSSCLENSTNFTRIKRGRPIDKESFKVLKDFETLYDPDKGKSVVYEKIAKDSIKSTGEDISNRDLVAKRRKAVKTMVERDPRTQFELSNFESDGPLPWLFDSDNPLPWLFKYLRRGYATPESDI